MVVLSEHPFSSPLTPLSQVAGPLFFSMGAPALKQVGYISLLVLAPLSTHAETCGR